MNSRGIMPARLQLGRWGVTMGKTWRAIFAAVAALLPVAAHAQPEVTARGAIIVDADTGAVIWELNADQPLPPASTTKVMTAVLALQSHRLDQEFVVSPNAAATPPSKIGLRAGQSVALRDLLYAVLLKSANDAAVVVAEGVSGSEITFADQMNLKARIAGATTTNFVNPHGLTEYGHLTTARDLSRIFRYGLGVPGFREVLSTTSKEVLIDGPDPRMTLVRTHNRLLNAPDYQVIGKTGYTRPARRCFVGAAGTGSREVVIAILGSTDLWGDARRMLYYGMSPNRPTPVLVASAGPPPLPTAVAQAAPAAEPAEELDRPAAAAHAEVAAAPAAAQERANRMMRAQGIEPARGPDDAADDPAAAAPLPPADEPQQIAEPAPEPEERTQRHGRRGSRRHRDIDGETAREMVVPADHEAPAVEEGAQPAAIQQAPAPAAIAPEPVAAPVTPPPAAGPDHRPAATAEPEPGADARDRFDEPEAARDRALAPSMWADSPIREPGQGTRRPSAAPAPAAEAITPVRAARDEQEPPARRPAGRMPADRAVDRERSTPATVARSAGQPGRRTAPTEADTVQPGRGRDRLAVTKLDDRRKPSSDDLRRKPSSEPTRVAGRDARRQAELDRDPRADRRRTASGREERGDDRRAAGVIRASAMDTRPGAMTTKGLEADRARTSRAARAGKRGADAEMADASGKYTVQLGPYRDRKAVATARADLAKRGYEARVVGQKLELGNFSERKRADRLATQLRVNGHRATSAEVR
jgi:serine-type D-Ala-D-Ala carboxypeptidase (penicillin-binding protein 5/6)